MPAYGQTDVMHDPDHLRAMLTHVNPRIREQAQLALRQLEIDQGRKQQLDEFQQRASALEENRATQQQNREDAMTQHRDALHESEAGRGERAGQLAAYREQSEKDRVAQGIAHAAEMSTDPAERKMLMGEYYKRIGFVPPAAPVDAKTAALQKFAGQPTTAPTTTAPVAPTGPSAALPTVAETMANARVNPNGSRTAQLPSGGTANYFDRTTPEGREAIGRPHDIPTARNLDTGVAPGTNQIGAIVPSGVMSERREIAPPFSPASLATNPPPNEGMQPTPVKPALPSLGGEQTAATSPTPFAPGSLAAPQPNPTPGPNAPPTSVVGPISFPPITAAPTAQPGATPPAQPPVLAPQRPVISDEERRRQLLQPAT